MKIYVAKILEDQISSQLSPTVASHFSEWNLLLDW
jgi:hypothetical protein